MANNLEITAVPGRLEIILDGHRIEGVTEYSIEHMSKKPPLLTLKVWITGELSFRPRQCAIRPEHQSDGEEEK